jgi:hypothetical protein
MSIDIARAILTRWTAAGLDSSIAPLYQGSQEGANPELDSAGIPSELPRAEFSIPSDPLASESRATNISEAIVVFEVWGTTPEQVGDFVSAIKNAILGSENSASNYLKMANGRIMSTHKVDTSVEQMKDAVHLGRYTLKVRYHENKTVPA